jgi:hypothetical protein
MIEKLLSCYSDFSLRLILLAHIFTNKGQVYGMGSLLPPPLKMAAHALFLQLAYKFQQARRGGGGEFSKFV